MIKIQNSLITEQATETEAKHLGLFLLPLVQIFDRTVEKRWIIKITKEVERLELIKWLREELIKY